MLQYRLAILISFISLGETQKCQPLKPPLYGSLSLPCGTAIKENCYFKCNSGHQILGSQFRTCKKGGKWTGIQPMCLNKLIVCPLLSPPVSGEYKTPCFNYAGAVCKFSCKNGFKLVGDDTSVCTINRRWTHSVPLCLNEQAKCKQLKVPKNVHIVGKCLEIEGSECRFGCDDGFKLSPDTPVVKCIKGKWSHSVPLCTKTSTTCSPLSAPENGKVSGKCTGHENDLCEFQCNNGFAINGKKQLTCLKSGKWSDKVPVCKKSCENINPSRNGFLSGKCSNAKEGDFCEFSCFTGYQLKGTKKIQCKANVWSAEIPICEEVRCPALNTLRNGRLFGNCSFALLSSVCSVVCNSGHKRIGNKDLKCKATGWSSPLPECRPISCPPLSKPENGIIQGKCQPGSYDEFCAFSCKKGYALIGNSTLLCGENGKWNFGVPKCIPVSCPSLQQVAFSSMSGDCFGNVNSGKKCSVFCDKCHYLVGQPTLTCLAPNWNSASPSCNPISCPRLTVPVNGFLTGQCDPGFCGSSCTFSCKPGFMLNGAHKLECNEKGLWSSLPPSCIPITCPALSAPVGGRYVGRCSGGAVPGQTCTFSCEDCYHLSGSQSLTCQANGKWDGIKPNCHLKSCSTVSAPSNADTTGQCNPGYCGSRCHVSCRSGFIPSNSADSVLTCISNGNWDRSVPQCLRTCPPVSKPENGYISGVCINAVQGNECNIVCNQNYKPVGSTKIACSSTGSWSEKPATCEPKGCGSILASYGGVWISECVSTDKVKCHRSCVGYPGQKCTLICSSGFTLVGNPSTVCDPKTLQWNPVPPKCQHDVSQRSVKTSKKGG